MHKDEENKHVLSTIVTESNSNEIKPIPYFVYTKSDDFDRGFKYNTGFNTCHTCENTNDCECEHKLIAYDLTYMSIYYNRNIHTYVRQVIFNKKDRVIKSSLGKIFFRSGEVSEKLPIEKFYIPEEYCEVALKNEPNSFIFIRNKTPELCMKMVKIRGELLRYVPEQNDELCMEAVKQNGLALEFVRNKTRDICMEAVKQNGISIKYIDERLPEICKIAVESNPYALEYVHVQTPEMCMNAVTKDGNTIKFVKNQTPLLCLKAVKQNPSSIMYIKEHHDEVCLYICQFLMSKRQY